MKLLLPATLFLILLALPPSTPAQSAQAVPQNPTPTLANDPAHPGATTGWVETQLFFGLGLLEPSKFAETTHSSTASRKPITEAQWLAFLDSEVTPRFPAGLSVEDIYGQWQGSQQPQPIRIRSKILIILYPNTAENQAGIEAIRTAWKRLTRDQSVLKVTFPADVSF